MKIVWAAFFIPVLIVILLISNINIRVSYCRKGAYDELIIIVSALFGLISIKNELNLFELLLNKSSALWARKGKALYRYRKYGEAVLRHKDTIKYIMRNVCIKKFKWHTVLGTGDAAVTGIAIGLLWNMKTIISTMLGAGFRMLPLPDLNIIPCFDGTIFSTSFDCILSIRIGHAITAGILFIILEKKDGDAVERASD